MSFFGSQTHPLKGGSTQLTASVTQSTLWQDDALRSRQNRTSSRFSQIRQRLLFRSRSAFDVADPVLNRIPRLKRSVSRSNLTANSTTNLTANLTASSTAPIGIPRVFNSPAFSVTDRVDRTNPTDFYRFTTNQSGIFTANLTGLSGDADVKLVQDRNNNGQIDQGEVIAWQWERGTRSESIRRFLNPGTYFVKVASYNNQTANYSLATNFAAAATDNRQFSIQLNFGQNLQNLNTAARNAINEAARFWEQVIPYSSFDRPQTLTINVQGTFRNDSVLAFAGPSQLARTSNNRQLPTAGSATINTRYNADYNRTPSFLRDTMIHEFGHVMGIGTLWETGQNLIDRASVTYRANTNAGWAYGEMLGTFSPAAVPVEPNIFGHWDEGRFREELMTPRAEGPGIATPLSQLTIASLRDLGWNVNYGAAQPYSLSRPLTAQSAIGATSVSSTSAISTSAISTSAISTSAISTSAISTSATLQSGLALRCGCAIHLAASGIKTLDSAHLSEMVAT